MAAAVPMTKRVTVLSVTVMDSAPLLVPAFLHSMGVPDTRGQVVQVSPDEQNFEVFVLDVSSHCPPSAMFLVAVLKMHFFCTSYQFSVPGHLHVPPWHLRPSPVAQAMLVPHASPFVYCMQARPLTLYPLSHWQVLVVPEPQVEWATPDVHSAAVVHVSPSCLAVEGIHFLLSDVALVLPGQVHLFPVHTDPVAQILLVSQTAPISFLIPQPPVVVML